MYLAGWSYSDLDAFQDMMGRAEINGVDCVEISTKNDPMFICATAQVIRSNDGKVAIVSFRGTELTNLVNWLTDATTDTIEAYPNGIKVHAGFLRNFQAIWPEIIKALCWQSQADAERDNYGNETYPNEDKWKKLEALYITGHSLGGAMCMLAPMSLYFNKEADPNAVHIAHFWSKLRGAYTFGQPMVLHHKYDEDAPINEISSYIFRHVFDKDIVPHLPPRSTGPYIHIGTERKPEEFEGNSYWIEVREYSGQVLSIAIAAPIGAASFVLDLIPLLSWITNILPWSFGDHSPWGYLYVHGSE